MYLSDVCMYLCSILKRVDVVDAGDVSDFASKSLAIFYTGLYRALLVRYCTLIYLYVCMYVQLYVCLCGCMYVCIYVDKYLVVCSGVQNVLQYKFFIRTYIHSQIYQYIYSYIHTYIVSFPAVSTSCPTRTKWCTTAHTVRTFRATPPHILASPLRTMDFGTPTGILMYVCMFFTATRQCGGSMYSMYVCIDTSIDKHAY